MSCQKLIFNMLLENLSDEFVWGKDYSINVCLNIEETK